MLNPGIQRSIVRWIHIVFSIPICGYIYTPFKDLPSFAPSIRTFFLPVLALSGLWLWKGHVVRRLAAGTSQSRTVRELTAPARAAASNN
jgi:hypothetical protein